MEKDINTPKSSFHHQRSLRDIQGAISRINPEMLKSLMGNANNMQKVPEEGQMLPLNPPLPFLSPFSRYNEDTSPETAPLTIFYNGTVAVFDVPKDKAEAILKFAGSGITKAVELTEPIVSVAPADRQHLLETLKGDLPIARKKSLQRFLEKRRKERFANTQGPNC